MLYEVISQWWLSDCDADDMNSNDVAPVTTFEKRPRLMFLYIIEYENISWIPHDLLPSPFHDLGSWPQILT